MRLIIYMLPLCFLIKVNTCYGLRKPGEDIKTESVTEVVSQQYDMLVGSSKVGGFNVSKTINGQITEYNATSFVEINFICSLSFKYTLHCVYVNKIMKSSKFVLYRNGKQIEETDITWNGFSYIVNKGGEIYSLNTPIYDSAIELYFEEPLYKKNFLSEKEGVVMEIQSDLYNNYNLMVPNNERDIKYKYQLHNLKEVVVDLFFTEFKMVRK